jgi:hypothetical protein
MLRDPVMIRNLIPLLVTGAIAAVAAIVYYLRPHLRPREKDGPPERPLSDPLGVVWENPTSSSHGSGQISSDCGGAGGSGDSGGGCDGSGGG